MSNAMMMVQIWARGVPALYCAVSSGNMWNYRSTENATEGKTLQSTLMCGRVVLVLLFVFLKHTWLWYYC